MDMPQTLSSAYMCIEKLKYIVFTKYNICMFIENDIIFYYINLCISFFSHWIIIPPITKICRLWYILYIKLCSFTNLYTVFHVLTIYIYILNARFDAVFTHFVITLAIMNSANVQILFNVRGLMLQCAGAIV